MKITKEEIKDNLEDYLRKFEADLMKDLDSGDIAPAQRIRLEEAIEDMVQIFKSVREQNKKEVYDIKIVPEDSIIKKQVRANSEKGAMDKAMKEDERVNGAVGYKVDVEKRDA